MAGLTLTGVTKNFGLFTAVRSLDCEISAGEFFAVLGPSGCGKTTLLRIIAGFELPSKGAVFLDGEDITRVRPQDRGIGMVFQNYALFPHMTVFDNVAFGLRARRAPEKEVREQAFAALESVRLTGKNAVPVPSLSGGEQQRVAVARAIALRPRLLLFDEPLSNLDVTLRLQTREEIRALQRATSITTVYVTHDQAEAMSLADRIGVMRDGALEQIGRPADVYEKPANPFVAEFLAGATLVNGRYDAAESFTADGFVLRLPREGRRPPQGPVTLAIKPEAISLSTPADPESLPAVVESRDFSGFTTAFRFLIGGIHLKALVVSSAQTASLGSGAAVWLRIDWRRCMLFPSGQ